MRRMPASLDVATELARDRYHTLKEESYCLSGRSDLTLPSARSEQTYLASSSEERGTFSGHSHRNLNTPSAWEAMYKLADARLAVATAEQERMRRWPLKGSAGVRPDVLSLCPSHHLWDCT